MEFFQSLLQNSSTPFLTAFILGLLTAISPCPLATNITAVGFISKDLENKHKIFWNGILYSIGRIITYILIGFILVPIIREGSSIFSIQNTISQFGEKILGPILVLIGFFMLFGDKLTLPSLGFEYTKSGDKLKKRGSIGALLLGILFAFAFCPTSGVFYFGMLIPMSAIETWGYLLILIFAAATALPVIIVAWILAYSVNELGRFYNRIKKFQKWFNIVIAIIFIVIGMHYIIIYYL